MAPFDRPFDISYEELRRLPSASTTATLECAGNSRCSDSADFRRSVGIWEPSVMSLGQVYRLLLYSTEQV